MCEVACQTSESSREVACFLLFFILVYKISVIIGVKRLKTPGKRGVLTVYVLFYAFFYHCFMSCLGGERWGIQ